MKKNRLINLIFHFNEDELLKKRLEYYKDVIDDFIVVDLKLFGVNSFDLLKTDEIKNIVKNIPNLNFDDVIWCSKVNEIIPIDQIGQLTTYSDFELYNHTILNWLDNLSCNRKITGSYIFTYSSVLRNNKLFLEIHYHIKYAKNFINNKSFGYTLIGFEPNEKLSESLNFNYNIDLTPTELSYYKTNQLSVDNYKTVEVLKDINCQLGGYFNGSFETRPPITVYVDILPEGLVIDDQIYEIELPKRYQLGSGYDYIKNEVLKYLKYKLLIDDDIIDIKNKTEDKSSVLKYIDLKNSIPSEIT